ncbi:unnamed protein product [Nippostrongylus brasiliensis]|uniref:Col_cuticle_N domain-containing protein n=1 Tax=Nippostrongylus brasiliensis TaxID=27835 RepID=A0A0N4YYB8_NIPBR|nr:unnamed protein product [Nippostrongylus brasiliensis]
MLGKSHIDDKILVYRLINCVTIAFTVVSTLSVCIALPIINDYMNHIKLQASKDVRYCKGSVDDMWSEIQSIRYVRPENHTRTQRQAGYTSPPFDGVPAATAGHTLPSNDVLPAATVEYTSAPNDALPAATDGYPSLSNDVSQAATDGYTQSSYGSRGTAGAPGPSGNPGAPGSPGKAGVAGEQGICPKYCALDGGIFFEDGTRR